MRQTNIKRRRIVISVIAALLASVTLVAIGALTNRSAACESSGCSGEYVNGICSVDPTHCQAAKQNKQTYEISNAGQLCWFAKEVNNMPDHTITAKLTTDIDMKGASAWTPFVKLGGNFDGGGHTISNLSGGFIKTLMKSTTLTNIIFKNPSVFDNVSGGAGVVVCENNGTIKNCLVVGGSIQYGAYDNFGIVVGLNRGTIESCGAVNCTATRKYGGSGKKNIGGIAETNNGTIKNCYTSGCSFNNALSAGAITTVCGEGAKVEGCYYNTSSKVDATYGDTIDADKVVSGELTYILNGNCSDSPKWYQTCGEGYPSIVGKTVYKKTTCDGKVLFENDTKTYDHEFDEEGFCKICGGYQPAKLVDGVYEIGNAGQLYWFSAFAGENQNINGKLVADITVNKNVLNKNKQLQADRNKLRVWIPHNLINSTFDGNFHTISGLFADTTIAGLFQESQHATIKNLRVVDTYFKGNTLGGACGGITARMLWSGTIEGCYFEGYLYGDNCFTGGISGRSYCYSYQKIEIKNCMTNASVNGQFTMAMREGDARLTSGITCAGLDLIGSSKNKGTVYVSNCISICVFGKTGNYKGDVIGMDINKTNCYATRSDYASRGDGTTYMSLDYLTSGLAAYAINYYSGLDTPIWYQNLDNGRAVDRYPTTDPTHGVVDYGYVGCEATELKATNQTIKETMGHEPDIVATCTDAATCTYCGKELGLDPTNHSSEETHYGYIDESSHGIYYSCCNTLVRTEDHALNQVANCGGVNHCSVCDTSFGEVDADNHTGTLECIDGSYGTHTYKWTCCKVIEKEEGHTLEYTVDDENDIISVVCTGCGATGKVTIGIWEPSNGTSKVYDAKKIDAYPARSGLLSRAAYWYSSSLSYCCDDDCCVNAGDHTLTLTFGDYSVTKIITIEKRHLTLTIVADDKYFDGTTDINIFGHSLGNILDGQEVKLITDNLKAWTSSPIPGNYSTAKVTGIAITGADAANYTIASELDDAQLKGRYTLNYFPINSRQIIVTPLDQTLVGMDSPIDQTKFTMSEIEDKFEISGIALVENNGYINVDCSNATITLDGEDVTEYFWFSTSMANVLRVCEGHTLNSEGFCSTGTCDNYQPAVKNDNGTPDDEYDDYYEIYNAGQLYWLAQQVNIYNRTNIAAKLMADIKVNDDPLANGAREWVPIACNEYMYYSANFDGNGHTISGLYCKRTSGYVGFFGSFGYFNCTNLHITNSYFEGAYAGAIAGYLNGGTISGCSVASDVTVKGSERTAGIAASTASGTIKNCYSLASIDADAWDGGLVSYNCSSIENCFTNYKNAVAYNNSSYGGSLSNVYYLSDEDDYTDGTTAVSDGDLSSGKIAWLLQSGVEGEYYYDEESGDYIMGPAPQIWYQTLGTDKLPVLDSTHGIVCFFTKCSGEDVYTNDNDAGPHEFVGNTCTKCGKKAVELEGYTLSLEGNIGVNFYMTIDEYFMRVTDGLRISIKLPDGTTKYFTTGDARINTTMTEGVTYYIFSGEVASYEMSDKVYISVMVGDDTIAEFDFTVCEYAEYIIDNSDDYTADDLAFAKALLNYGASSQIYFDHNTNNLANKDLLDADRVITPVTADDLSQYERESIEKEGVGKFVGFNLALGSKTSLRAYFILEEGIGINDVEFTANGERVKVERVGDYLRLVYDDVLAWELDDDVEFVAMLDGEAVTLSCSAMSYCHSVLVKELDEVYTAELRELISAMRAYQIAAETYGT